VSLGLRDPLLTLVPPSLAGAAAKAWPSYNPKRARQLYRQAGFCGGKVLSLPLTFRTNVPTDRLFALTWQAQVRQDLGDCLQLELNGMEATTAYRQLGDGAFALILLDWMLPGESGASLARQWRKNDRTKSVPIIMLTARSDESDKIQGLDAGADDYITKPFSTQEMLARIRALMRRRAPETIKDSVQVGELILDASTYRVSFQSHELKIGPTEFKLLHYLMKHAERVHSRSTLLDKVWGDHVFIEERTVDVHVKRLRESLGDASCMVETVRGAGYRLTVQGKPVMAA
jgi:two-component system phosphate regulon response regulator PhoB